MQVQNLSNTNSNRSNFQGGVRVLGKFSSIPAKQLETAVPKLKTLFENKKFDLFIKEDFDAKQLIFSVQKPEHFAEYDKPYIKYSISSHAVDKSSGLYYSVAKYAAERYEKLGKKNQFAAKCREFFYRLRISLSNAIDMDEV